MARQIYKAVLTVISASSIFMLYGTIDGIDRGMIAYPAGIYNMAAYAATAAVCIFLLKLRRKRKWLRV